MVVGSLLAVSLATPAIATAGAKDDTFGDGGRAITGWDGPIKGTPYWEIRGCAGSAFDVEIQADGGIVLAGAKGSDYRPHFALARHLPDGTTDPSFAGDGIVGAFNVPGFAVDATIQADDDIVAVGTVGRRAGTIGGELQTHPGSKFALVRLHPDGSFDETFSGDGRVQTAFGDERRAQANAVAIGSDGKLVVVGSAGHVVAAARYLADGSLDPSFSANGKLRARSIDGSRSAQASDVAVLGDGKIVIAAVACDRRRCRLVLARFLSDGSLDATFGHDGVVRQPMTGPSTGDLVAQVDGKLVVGAFHQLFRFDEEGSLDTSFSDDGWARTGVAADGVALQTDGSILVSGTGPIRESGTWVVEVSRFLGTGVLDTAFGNDGTSRASFPGFENASYGVTIQPDGKIVAAGTTSDVNVDGKWAVARFLGG
jgi:uncharacterized delta-60 repeat protein